MHFNADASNTEFLFRIVRSVNQLSIHGAVSSWCEEFGRAPYRKEDASDKSASNENDKILKSVNSQEVKSLAHTPRKQQASGKRWRESLQKFESLAQTMQDTKVCELASFWHRETILDVDDSFWSIHSIMPRIWASSSRPKIQSERSDSRCYSPLPSPLSPCVCVILSLFEGYSPPLCVLFSPLFECYSPFFLYYFLPFFSDPCERARRNESTLGLPR